MACVAGAALLEERRRDPWALGPGMSDPKGGDASPAKKYRLRVDVAKPAELYKPTFGPSRTSPGGANGKGTPLGFFPGTPLAPDDSRPIEPAVLRALEGGKRNRKPVDRMPAGGIEVTPAAAASASLDKASGDGNGARIIQRILSRRVHEGGSTSYLIVWGNGQVTNATWHSRASLGAATPTPSSLKGRTLSLWLRATALWPHPPTHATMPPPCPPSPTSPRPHPPSAHAGPAHAKLVQHSPSLHSIPPIPLCRPVPRAAAAAVRRRSQARPADGHARARDGRDITPLARPPARNLFQGHLLQRVRRSSYL